MHRLKTVSLAAVIILITEIYFCNQRCLSPVAREPKKHIEKPYNFFFFALLQLDIQHV